LEEIETKEDREWNSALEAALRLFAEPRPGLLLFVEQREDLVIELRGSEAPRSSHTFTGGISARGPFDRPWSLYRAGPEPGDAERLVRSAIDPRVDFPVERKGERPPASPSPVFRVSELADWIQTLVDRLRRSSPGTDFRARWVGFEQRVRIARPGRALAIDVRRGRRIRIDAFVAGAETHGPAVCEAVLPAHLGVNEEAIATMIGRLERDIERRRQATEARRGARTVVLAPGVGGILVHELVGHALEADTLGRDGSWLGSASAQSAVASTELTVIDDPRRGRAPWRVDDEAEPSRAVPLLRAGIVVGRLQDARSAADSGSAPTGHGRRSSFREPVRPRMGCTFIAAGERTADEIRQGVVDGIYVRRMEAATTDPASGRATFRVTDADRIHRGRLDAPLQPHLLRVEGRDVLRSTVLVADDLEFDRCVGSCHRDGQPLAISVGAPTICIGLATALA
jgi:predicted Zn-dependent protease